MRWSNVNGDCNVKDLLERKLKQLQEGLEQLKSNIKAQTGAIQVVEQLLEEVAEVEAAEAVAVKN